MTLRLVAAFAALSFSLTAATSTAWDVSGFGDFLKGRLSGLSLQADGRLQLGPAIEWNTALRQPALWRIAAGRDGTLFAATGHTGKLFRLSPDGHSTVLWTAGQTELFALCVDAQGNVFAGSSPRGGVYRVTPDGKAEEIWRAPAKYIWALEPQSDGSLFVATGEPGRVYKLDTKTKAASLYYDTGQPNVTSLATGPGGHLYTGTDPNGILYDISGPNTARVLYDSSLPEIRSIVVDAQGTVFAAAMGGAVASRSTTPPSSTPTGATTAVATTPTVITVTESAAAPSSSPADEQATKPADTSRTSSSVSSTAPAASASAVVEVSGVEKSAIYRIQPNGAIDTLRSSKDDNVYALALDRDGLLFSTDDHGRIYRIAGGRISLVSDPGSGETTGLVTLQNKIYAGLSNPARFVSYGPPGSGPGTYESQVHDCSSVARWGHLQWYGEKTGVVFRTRTGYSARPDQTWSAWSSPVEASGATLIPNPPARFIQFRAEWPAGSTAQIYSVEVPYLPQNAAPAVHSITVSGIVGTNPAKSGSASATAAYSVTVTDTGTPPAASTSSSASQSVSRLQTTQAQVSWQADDPDNDKLAYTVYFRAEEASDWQLIRSKIFENTLLLDPDVFADGRYFFKVVASDAPSNVPEFARQSELVSPPILIDSTPPVILVGTPQRTGSSFEIELEAQDATSPLRLCEYSLDAGSWQPIESVDGITDSKRERFRLRISSLRPGEHLLVFRVYDAANNAGLAKVIIR